MKGKRTNGIVLIVAAACVVILLPSCNLAQLFGLQAAPALQAYAVQASNNPSLASDATGLIEGTDIYLSLPYGPVTGGTPLTPTVKLASGYSISPSGAYAIRDGMTLTVTQDSSAQTTSYRLHVSEIPSTTPSAGPASAIASFAFSAAANPGVLSADANGVVYGTNVYVTLPYVVVSEMQGGTVKLSSTVSLQSPYTLTSPAAGTPYAYTDGMTLDVTDTATQQSYNYILHISATPNAQFSGSSSLVLSYSVTHALNPATIPADSDAVINGTNIYLTLPLAVVENHTTLTPAVALASGYSISSPSSSSYPLSDGMTLVITQATTGAFTDYTLHVGTSAASMAFLQLASPFYYDASGTKQELSSSQYNLAFDATSETYTLTLDTDAFSGEMPSMAAYVQSVVTSRPVGFATVSTPYNATVTGASAAQSGAVSPYTITVKSADATVTNTYTVTVVRTPSAWIGVSSASVAVENAYNYTDTPSWGASLSNWQGQSSGLAGTSNQQVYWNGGVYGGACSGGQYTFSPNSAANTNATNAAVGASDSGAIVATPSVLSLPTNLTLSASSSYPALASPGVVSTRTGSFSVTSPYSTLMEGGQGCGIVTTGSGTANASPSLTVYLGRTYTSAGYVVPTSFTVNIPLAITIESVTGITDLASYTITAGSTDNTVSLTMGPDTARISGSVAAIACEAESGATLTLYVTVQ